MKNSKKIRVMVLYGGRSGEHEISLRSAASVIRYLDKERFEIIPVAIDKQGKWLLNDVSLIEKSVQALPVYKDAPSVVLAPHPGPSDSGLIRLGASGQNQAVDVVFPVMHGPLCEDGSIQGLLELADLPYVGSGVLSSAVGMDKDFSKRLVKDAGLPVVPCIVVKDQGWKNRSKEFSKRVEKELGYPVFIKPANMGSSVGVKKVKEAAELPSALENAFRYDTKVLIEQSIQAREIEFSVLENVDSPEHPLVSVAGEIVPKHEFYSYEAKYLDENGASLIIPAELEPSQLARAKEIAQKAFLALECEGMARVDLFLDKQSGALYFNELNTLPGFTSISMYPKLWEHSGLPYPELLSKLIDLALARHQKKTQLVRDFHA